jgi:hypothetical protein
MTRKTLGALALCISSLVIFALPAGSFAGNLNDARDALVKAGQQLQSGLETTVQKAGDATANLVDKTKGTLKKATAKSDTRATATDPPTQPPTHGDNPHGQGSVAVVDLNPSAERPLAADPDGGDSGEDVVVGRARGEKNADGTYHGHITGVGLFGNDVIPVDTAQGETKDGPLQSLQASILDPLCTNTNQQVCLTVLRMHSETTATGSSNDFAIARASLLGLGVGAADSQGVTGQKGACRASAGAANTANVATSSGTIASTTIFHRRVMVSLAISRRVTVRDAETADSVEVPSLLSRRDDQSPPSALPKVDGEVRGVDADHRQPRILIAQRDEARVGKVNPAIRIGEELRLNACELFREKMSGLEGALFEPAHEPLDRDFPGLLEQEHRLRDTGFRGHPRSA